MRWFRLTAARTVTPRSPERGDVPGWVLITGMTVALASVRLGRERVGPMRLVTKTPTASVAEC
jgi:hypothetical protein